jgi:ABC-type multidrug transport system ATPase subunit
VLALEGISKAFGDNQVLRDVSLTIRRGARLAIIGPNGIGKSTLLKIAMERLDADSGTVEWGHETYPGYFAQDYRELLLKERQTVEEFLWAICPAEPIGFVRGQLAQVLFSKDEVKKRLASLSGGEAARLLFAKLAVEQPNVLILDEPTNHLDLEAIEALVAGLQEFDGTLVFVSHDRWFVSQLADHIVEITPDGLRIYEGTYEEYVDQCGDDHLDADSVALKVRREKRAKKKKARAAGRDDSRDRNRIKHLGGERDKLTTEIETAENRVHEINEIFCDPAYFDRTSPAEVRKLEQEQKSLSARVDELMARWQEVEEELARLEG